MAPTYSPDPGDEAHGNAGFEHMNFEHIDRVGIVPRSGPERASIDRPLFSAQARRTFCAKAPFMFPGGSKTKTMYVSKYSLP